MNKPYETPDLLQTLEEYEEYYNELSRNKKFCDGCWDFYPDSLIDDQGFCFFCKEEERILTNRPNLDKLF